MENKKRLEEAMLEVEKSKSILEESENKDKKESSEEKETTETGSGIFTVDGKELPKVEGGYDIINPGSTLSDDGFVSV